MIGRLRDVVCWIAARIRNRSRPSRLGTKAPEDNNPYLALGGEHRWVLTPETSAALRAGFNTRTVGQVDSFTGMTLGGGLTSGSFSLDYAFLPMGSLGNTHRVSISIRFDTGRVRPSLLKPSQPLECESFHGINICDVPNGMFFLAYRRIGMRGNEPYDMLKSKANKLDLFPTMIDWRDLLPAEPSAEFQRVLPGLRIH